MKNKTKNARFKFSKALSIGMFLGGVSALAAPTAQDLENSIAKRNWSQAAEIARELIRQNPHHSVGKLKGAYSLFQKGYANSALVFLKKLSVQDWAHLPQDQKGLVEVVALFQKKIPPSLLPLTVPASRLTQISEGSASPILRDEIRFAKGQHAYEEKKYNIAKQNLNAVRPGSRYFVQARYLLATISVLNKDYELALTEFSRMFEPTVYEQSSEFWKDLSTQTFGVWGTNIKVLFDTASLVDSIRLGDLAILGMARTYYAQGKYKQALERYNKIGQRSEYYPKAILEKIWTLWAMGDHDRAEKVAAKLSEDESHPSFEGVEARILRALVLVDQSKVDQSREQIQKFWKIYDNFQKRIRNFKRNHVISVLPKFLKEDLKRDRRMTLLQAYRKSLEDEISKLKKEDHKLFPVYRELIGELDALVNETKKITAKYLSEHVERRKKDLDWLLVQSRLILIESYLEDREKLRAEFKSDSNITPERQKEHDRRLVALLTKAVDEGDRLVKEFHVSNTALDFRHSEILWELGSVKAMIAQSEKNAKLDEQADEIRKRALRIAKFISDKKPKFQKHAQSLFFTGYAQMELGITKAALRTFRTFIAKYPKHEHAPDALRILGDALFDENRFAQAEELYRKILHFSDSPIVGYAFYKIGWCAYNQHAFSRALLSLEKAASWAHEEKNIHQLSLRKEARHDLIALFAEVGDHRKAFEYFGKFVPKKESREWIIDLAKELDQIGQYEKSRDLYRTLILTSENEDEIVEFHSAIILGTYHLRDWSSVVESARALVGGYKEKLSEPQSKDSLASIVEENFRTAVLGQLFEWKKTHSAEAAKYALALNELYLEAFSNWPISQEPLYRHAHFLLETKNYEKAAEVFISHWSRFSSTLKEPLREEALRNVIHSLEQVSPSTPENSKKLIEYASEYNKEYSTTKYARSIDYLKSALLIELAKQDKDFLDDALEASQSVFEQNPTDDMGKRAFDNLRATYYELKDWQRTYDWANSLSQKKNWKGARYKDELDAIREESLFLLAQDTSDSREAAELYLKIANDPSSKRLKEKSLYNAFVHLEKSGQKVKALEVAEVLEKKNPQSEWSQSSQGIQSALYQEAGDYEKAYVHLVQFLKIPPKGTSKEALDQAYLNAGLIAQALEDKKTALLYFKKSSHPEAKKALERLTSQKQQGASLVKPINWERLFKEKSRYESNPLPSAKDLAAEIKKGAHRLESLAKKFVDLSKREDISAFFAFEAYCALPFLYKSYGESVLKLADKVKEEKEALLRELRKIADPIENTASEYATNCIQKASSAEHTGPNFFKVGKVWGWQKDSKLLSDFYALRSAMEKQFPFVDNSDSELSEQEIVRAHLHGEANEQTWYQLALLRWKKKKQGLARLTLMDAIAHGYRTGRVLNLLAITQESELTTAPFEQAKEEGSNAAAANLVFLHLRGERLPETRATLKDALDASFIEDTKLEPLAQKILEKES